EGHTIEAWLLRPPEFDASAVHPLLLQIHGGPYAAYGNAFVFEFHWLAAQGYCVLFANPRGSQGYGYEFAAVIRKDLAAPAHSDLMAAVDLVASRPYVDADRLGVTGGSWGGYMTNWIVTQTERFRAALAQRSISDFELDFGVSDFGYEVEWMFGGPPWTHREVYERCSPLTYVENVRTPLLLLHSDHDWRCPPMQAEIFYGALKMLGREVEMVRFPKESHGLSRSGTPSRRLERLRVIGEWFARHLTPGHPDPGAMPRTSGEPAEREPEGVPVR
ncbi:MAG: alpha/beta hydrolase family protein, partial [Candidatus Rokuibacteriota bacterium]